MITPETRAEIFRCARVEHLSVRHTARLLGIHHSTVKRVLESDLHSPTLARIRKSNLDEYAPFIQQKLEEYPKIKASRIWRMLKDRGYPGSDQSVRRYVQMIRGKQPKKAYLPITAFAGDEAQVDWAHFGEMTVGRTKRKLSCFVMCRHQFKTADG